MRTLRILHVIPALSPGGAESALIDMIFHQSNEGNEVTLLLADVDASKERLREVNDNVRIIFLPFPKATPFFYLRFIAYVLRNKNLFAENDILHGHLTFGSIALNILKVASAVFRWRGAFVETHHAVGMPIRPAQKFIFFVGSFLRDAVVKVAPASKGVVQYQSVFGTKYLEIRNGVRTSLNNTDTSKSADLNLGNRVILIGNVGRLVKERAPYKLFAVFIRVIEEARASGLHLNIEVGGEGPELHAVQEQIALSRVEDRIRLLGLLTNPVSIVREWDLYISLNVGDMTGLAGLEAIAAGVPVISLQMDENYLNGAEDVIWSGFQNDLINKIIELAASAKERQMLWERQYHLLRAELTSEVMAEKYMDLYQSLNS